MSTQHSATCPKTQKQQPDWSCTLVVRRVQCHKICQEPKKFGWLDAPVSQPASKRYGWHIGLIRGYRSGTDYACNDFNLELNATTSAHASPLCINAHKQDANGVVCWAVHRPASQGRSDIECKNIVHNP